MPPHRQALFMFADLAPLGRGAILKVPAVKEFASEVGLVARVRVRAADEASARVAVSSVTGAPGSAEITLANEGNAALGSDAVVTAVDFIVDRKVKLVRR